MSSDKKSHESYAMDGDVISPKNIAHITQFQKPSQAEQAKHIKASEVPSRRTVESVSKSITPKKK